MGETQHADDLAGALARCSELEAAVADLGRLVEALAAKVAALEASKVPQ